MTFLHDMVRALPAIAAHPLALLGYVVVAVCWLILELRVHRNKNLLSHISKLPREARLKALEMEMGYVRVKGGIEPEQWLKQKIHLYYFVLAALLLFTVLTLSIVAIVEARHSRSRSSVPQTRQAVHVMGSDNQIVQGNNNVVARTVYYGTDDRLTTENVEKVAVEYAGGNIEKVIAYSIVENPGQMPYLLLIFRSPEDYIYKVHSVKFKSGSWRTSWAGELPERPYLVGSQHIEHLEIEGRGYYIFSGCYPHWCLDAWGLFVFDPRLDQGFAAVSAFHDGNVRFSFPLGLPEKQLVRSDFIVILHKTIIRSYDKRRPPSGYAEEERLRTLAETSLEIEPVPNLLRGGGAIDLKSGGAIDLDANDVLDFPAVTAFLRVHPGLSIKQIHVADFDGDKKVEWLVFGKNSHGGAIAIVDEDSVRDLPAFEEAARRDWFVVGIYRPVASPSFIVIGTLLGASGNFSEARIFAREGDGYRAVRGEAVESAMKEKFGIKGAFD